jgi:hypothetical protein
VAKWTPRTTPRRDTDQLACAVSGQYPSDSDSSPARNHSRKCPRSSRCTTGVDVQAPPILVGSMYHSSTWGSRYAFTSTARER